MVCAPALAKSATWRSGASIIRWTSYSTPGRPRSTSALRTCGPIDSGGTKWPSMMSTWMTVAPASTTSATCAPRRAKSAARMLGAMRRGEHWRRVSATAVYEPPGEYPQRNEPRARLRLRPRSASSRHSDCRRSWQSRTSGRWSRARRSRGRRSAARSGAGSTRSGSGRPAWSVAATAPRIRGTSALTRLTHAVPCSPRASSLLAICDGNIEAVGPVAMRQGANDLARDDLLAR